MSQQEDDLRALAKIMYFLRAISIVLVVINIFVRPDFIKFAPLKLTQRYGLQHKDWRLLFTAELGGECQ